MGCGTSLSGYKSSTVPIIMLVVLQTRHRYLGKVLGKITTVSQHWQLLTMSSPRTSPGSSTLTSASVCGGFLSKSNTFHFELDLFKASDVLFSLANVSFSIREKLNVFSLKMYYEVSNSQFAVPSEGGLLDHKLVCVLQISQHRRVERSRLREKSNFKRMQIIL